MRVIKINRYRIAKRALAVAEDVLRSGGVVAFPTETAYGLAADPNNPAALDQVMCIKGRSADKRLPLVAASVEQTKRFFVFTSELAEISRKYWPGPLTVVLPVQHSQCLDGWPEAAVRVPAAAWARALPAAVGCPVTATSANLSGQPPCYSGTAVRQSFRGRAEQPDLLLDAGRLPERPPSTIVKAVRGRIKVLRLGPIVDIVFN